MASHIGGQLGGAHVGAHLETVETPRSLFGPDYFRLLILAAISLAIHGWLLTHTALTARDSIGFARYALKLERPAESVVPPDPSRSIVEVIKSEEHPPGFPVVVLLASHLVRATADVSLPHAMLLGAQLANALAGVLLVVPTYLLGRMLFGRDIGFGVALLVQVLPGFARVTSDGLSEGVYLLGVTTALTLGVRAVRRPAIGAFLVTGLATGLTYLVRPEGLFTAASVGLVVAILGILRKWPRDAALARLTALAVGISLVAGPYMLMIGRLTNKPTVLQILQTGENPRAKLWKGQPTSQAVSASTPLWAVWWSEAEDAGSSRILWAVKGVIRETFKTAFYVPAFLGLMGLIAFRRRILSDPGLGVIVLLAGVNALVLTYMAASKGYVSERHTVVLALVLCLFGAAAADPVTGVLARLPMVGRFWAGRYAAPGLLLAIVVGALPSTLKPLHAHRVGHKHAGEFLATRIQPQDNLIDPFAWASWYAGQSLLAPPVPSANPTAVWVVLEHISPENPHSRLEQLDAALAVMNDPTNPPTVVYQWPENVPFEQADVFVLKQTAVRPK